MEAARQLLATVFSRWWVILAMGGTLAAQVTGSVSVSLERSVVSQHEPVIVDLTIRNESPGALYFDPGYGLRKIVLGVTGPDGRLRKTREAKAREGMEFSNAVQVDPGGVYVLPILLSDRFDMEALGSYRIDVTSPLPDGGPGGETASAKVALELTVAPRDEERLKTACAELVGRIRDSPRAYVAIVAGQALSSVDDPAVVPFLAQALGTRPFAGMIISALARLKTNEAIDVIERASRSSDPETSSLAHSALVNLARGKGP
jgi:hypothetical protein